MPVFSLLFFLKERIRALMIAMLYVFLLQLLNQLADLHENWYERCASGDYPDQFLTISR
jgi:hypothetical protein